MRPHPFDPGERRPPRQVYEPDFLVTTPEPAQGEARDPWGQPFSDLPDPEPRRAGWGRWIVRAVAALLVLLAIAIVWLAITAPLSRSLEPPAPPSVTLTAADGTPIARRGAIIGRPVDASKLPAHVRDAFVAIEDRRFYSHWGIDPRGIARAALHNVGSGGVREGGSTITQQLAKNAFLDSDRTAARKIREAMIALWLEAWLSKNDILSRYLSNVYFGDNVYGMTAAAKHYFGRTPDKLNVGQAAMLAGLVKAPSRLAPTGNLAGARARQAIVVAAMVDAGLLGRAEAARVQPQRVLPARTGQLPSGTYFADWVLPAAREAAGEVKSAATVRTTLDRRLQAQAERVVARARLNGAQAALVAMRTDGRVVAMVGGRDYRKSPFNRATQAKRQPGSSFKLFVYLAAIRAGMAPGDTVEDSPIDIAGWKPRNDDGRYLGRISLARAFARSSNVAAARLTQEVGVLNVIRAARDLGISTPIPNEATIALGTAEVSLLELTAAYAAVANGRYPVRPHGIDAEEGEGDRNWLRQLTGRSRAMPGREVADMRSLLGSALRGTGRAASLPVPAYGKTGTTQQSRDVWFIGWAGDLVVGVWVGHDDNRPMPGLHGGDIPAQAWRQFMMSALDLPEPAIVVEDEAEETSDDVGNLIGGVLPKMDDALEQLDRLGIDLGPRDPRRAEPPPEEREPAEEDEN